jgi:hypothetical protein
VGLFSALFGKPKRRRKKITVTRIRKEHAAWLKRRAEHAKRRTANDVNRHTIRTEAAARRNAKSAPKPKWNAYDEALKAQSPSVRTQAAARRAARSGHVEHTTGGRSGTGYLTEGVASMGESTMGRLTGADPFALERQVTKHANQAALTRTNARGDKVPTMNVYDLAERSRLARKVGLCGAPTKDKTACQNNAGTCPWHRKGIFGT